MKITDSEVIRGGEQELIDAITGDLDWGVVERIFKERHGLRIQEDVEYKGGDIVVHDNRIAYRLEFEAKVTLSILLDREGNHIAVKSSEDPAEERTPRGIGEEDNGNDSGDGGYEKILAEIDSPEGPGTGSPDPHAREDSDEDPDPDISG